MQILHKTTDDILLKMLKFVLLRKQLVKCFDKLTDEQKKDLAEAYKVFQKNHSITPVDIYENPTPSEWIIDGETIKYEW